MNHAQPLLAITVESVQELIREHTTPQTIPFEVVEE